MFKVLSGNVLHEITENEARAKPSANIFILLASNLINFFLNVLYVRGKNLTNNIIDVNSTFF